MRPMRDFAARGWAVIGVAACWAAATVPAAEHEGGHQPKPSVSLTLIPPSPVTDQIVLDVRGAVWNHADAPRTFEAAFYLDDSKPENQLHRERLEVGPGLSKGVRLRWPTASHAGRRRIIFTARSGANTLRAEQPIRILASKTRSTQMIGGAWVGIYHWSEDEGRLWNAAIRKMTDAQWRELVRAMHEIGMDIVVLQEVFRNQKYHGKHSMEKDGYTGRGFYPSRLYPGRMPIAAKDPPEAILSQADRLGMHVFMGVGLYAWFDYTADSLEFHKQVASELWDMYGHHGSFYGWYVSEEVFGSLAPAGAPVPGEVDVYRKEIVGFFDEFQRHCRRLAPDKPVMLAPNCYSVPRGVGTWAKLLKHCDIICPFGFHRMPDGDLRGEEAAALLQKLCDEAEAHLWMDMEVFLFGEGNALYPRPIRGLVDDMRRFPNFEKILCYQFPGLMNAPWMSRKPGGPATVKLYQDYQRFRDEGSVNPEMENR